MPKELPIEYPFKSNEERLLIGVFFIFILLLTFGFFNLSPNRGSLIAKIPPTETNSGFVINQVYEQTSDIDALILGPCTAWWQIYTPYIQERLSQKYRQQAQVITLGYNHFGSDLMYLLLKDVLQKRKVKNLVLTLPKVEDLYPFPHQNAVNWWIYPSDLDAVQGISFVGYLRILGLNLFSAIYRSSLKGESLIDFTPNLEYGFNSLRDLQRIQKSQLPIFDRDQYVKVITPAETDLDSQHNLSVDWIRFYQLIFDLVKSHNINVVFVDSPHVAEFETTLKTVPGNFAEVTSSGIPVIAIDFKKWYSDLPIVLQNQIYAGHNLTAIGAQTFTDLIKDKLVEHLQ